MSTIGIRDLGHKFMPALGKARTYSREFSVNRSLASSNYQQQPSKNIIPDGKIFHAPKSTMGNSNPIGFSKALNGSIPRAQYSTKNDSYSRNDYLGRSVRESEYKVSSDHRLLKANMPTISKETRESLNSSRPDSQENTKRYQIRGGVSKERADKLSNNSSNNRNTPLGGSRSGVVRNSSVAPTFGSSYDKHSANYKNETYQLLGGKDTTNGKKNVVITKNRGFDYNRDDSPTFGGKVSSQASSSRTNAENLVGGHSSHYGYPARDKKLDRGYEDRERASPTFGTYSEKINSRLQQYKASQDYSTIQNPYDRDGKSSRGSDRSTKGYSQSNNQASTLMQEAERAKPSSTYSYGAKKPESLMTDSDDKKIDRKVTSHVAVNASPNNSVAPKGLVGLRNIGNTCFMNSILQCLFNAPMLSDYFLRGNHKKEKNSKSKGLADAFASILEKMRSHSGPPSYSAETPSELKSKIAKINAIFSGYDQHDAQELLKALLEGMNDDLNRVVTKPPYKELTADPKRKFQDISDEWFNYMLARDNSVITDLFCGQLLSKATCMHCGSESLAFDNFWDLALSFTKGASSRAHLNDMLEQFLKEEELEDLFGCEKCKTRRKHKKRFVIWRLPKILVVQLKRFEYTRYRRDKINKTVTFPVKSFDLSKYTGESTDSSTNDAKYSLFGIVNHGGSLSGGHYTAECMNPYDRKWYDFNDSHVSKTSMREDEADGSSPYILFYIKTSCLTS